MGDNAGYQPSFCPIHSVLNGFHADFPLPAIVKTPDCKFQSLKLSTVFMSTLLGGYSTITRLFTRLWE